MAACEESGCKKFQAVVCLHCMRRVCIEHMEAHQKILVDKVETLKDEVDEVTTDLTNAARALIVERSKEEQKWERWRAERLAAIERDYIVKRNATDNRRKVLEQQEAELNQRLKLEVQQPLEQMLSTKSVNLELFNTIQLTVQTLRRDIELLTWEDESPQTPEIAKASGKATGRSRKSTAQAKKPWKPRNHLIQFFRDVGPTSASKIHEYVQTQMKDKNAIEQYGLITLVFSFLETWHKTKEEKGRHKQLILNKHITTVKRYVNRRDDQRKVLIAMQFFFNSLKMEESAGVELMTQLLQLFLQHECISVPEMIHWHRSETFADEAIGKKLEKRWAEPFLTLHGYCTATTNTSVPTAQIPEDIRSRPPFKNLVKLFKDHLVVNDLAIHDYIKNQYKTNVDQRVIMLVRCYLKAWLDSSPSVQPTVLVNKIVVIRDFKPDPNFQMQILFATEIFLEESKKQGESWSIETLSMLLQFFLDHRCLDRQTILQWNEHGHPYPSVYYGETKRFARSFIERLIVSN